MLREELRRALLSRGMLLAVLIGLGALGYRLTDYCLFGASLPGAHPLTCNPYDAVLWAERGPISLLVPLIAVLPFADSYALDRMQGFLRHIMMRASYRRYMLGKSLANALVGGLAIAIPLLLFFAFTNIVYPRGILPIEESRVVVGGIPDGPLGELYRTLPDLYILFLVGLGFLAGAGYATLALAISTIVNNRYIILATPFLLFFLLTFVLQRLGLERWGPYCMTMPDAIKTSSPLTVFGSLGILYAVGILIVLALARKGRAHA